MVIEILLMSLSGGMGKTGIGLPVSGARKRARSAATVTTATTRNAAQIYCAALGERKLDTG
jgi:hypothetical protein